MLVMLGFGATVAVLTESLPFLVTLSQHKEWMFIGTAGILGLTAWVLWRPGRACPTDPSLAALCERNQVWNRRLWGLAVVLWSVGAFVSYLWLPLRIWWEH